jgi:hypothetical protein
MTDDAMTIEQLRERLADAEQLLRRAHARLAIFRSQRMQRALDAVGDTLLDDIAAFLGGPQGHG